MKEDLPEWYIETLKLYKSKDKYDQDEAFDIIAEAFLSTEVSDEDLEKVLNDIIVREMDLQFIIAVMFSANMGLGPSNEIRNKFAQEILPQVEKELKDDPAVLAIFKIS